MKCYGFILGLMLLFACREALGQSQPVINRKITIDEAVEVALKESPVVRGAQSDVDVAIGRLNSVRAETRPWLSANAFASGGSENNVAAGPAAAQPQMFMGLPRGSFADANLMLMYPLFTGGRLSAMIRQAASNRDASRFDLAALRQEVALMTRMAYREALARTSLVAVAQDRLKENQERLRVDKEKFERGAVPLVTVRRDEAEVAAGEQELTNTERDVELAYVQLRTVMGISPSSRIELVGANEYQPSVDLIKRLLEVQEVPPSDQARDRLIRFAERNRPELQAAEQRIRGSQAETSAAKSTFLPQVNLFAMGDVMKSKESDAFAGATFGVSASLPLYNGGQRKAKVQAAEAERKKQEQERNRIGLQVVQEVSMAYLNFRAAEKNIATAKKAQAAAQEGYRVAQARFNAGRSVLVELLDALAARTQAESSVVQALFQYNVSIDQLLKATGSLVH